MERAQGSKINSQKINRMSGTYMFLVHSIVLKTAKSLSEHASVPPTSISVTVIQAPSYFVTTVSNFMLMIN